MESIIVRIQLVNLLKYFSGEAKQLRSLNDLMNKTYLEEEMLEKYHGGTSGMTSYYVEEYIKLQDKKDMSNYLHNTVGHRVISSMDNNKPFEGTIYIAIDPVTDNVLGHASIVLTDYKKYLVRTESKTEDDIEDIYYVNGVGVRLENRGNGICQRLMTAMLDDYKYANVYLCVAKYNESAIKAYEKVGFVDCDTLVDKDGIDRYKSMVHLAE